MKNQTAEQQNFKGTILVEILKEHQNPVKMGKSHSINERFYVTEDNRYFKISDDNNYKLIAIAIDKEDLPDEVFNIFERPDIYSICGDGTGKALIQVPLCNFYNAWMNNRNMQHFQQL